MEHLSRSVFSNMLAIHYKEYINRPYGALNALSWNALNKISESIIYRSQEESDKPLSHIIDMGSGMSSVMLRLLKLTKLIPEQTNIFTVDHSNLWLEKTIEYCKSKNLPEETFILWDDFREVLPDWIKFNVIIFDIDYTSQREKYLEFVLKEMIGRHSETDLWLDDMHKPGLRANLLNIVSRNTKAHRIIEFMEEKEESTGRYFALVRNILT